MKQVKQCLAVALFAIMATGAKAQVEPHFSQYYMYPLWLNPALTGAIDGNYRVSVLHRDQWSSITNPFSTVAVSGDVATDKDINFGLNILQQSAGDAGYKYSNGQVSVSYSGIRLGREGDKVITFGMQAGLLGRRVDFSKAQTNDQYINGVYSSSNSTGEMNPKTSGLSFDAGAGVFYYDADPDKKVNVFAGFSAGHLTQPKDPFLSTGTDVKLPIRYTAHGGLNIYLSDNAHLVPNVLVMTQGNNTESMVGGYLQMAINNTTDITGGINYRIKDAVYPYLGLKLNDFTFGASYDVNTSNLGKLANGASSFELSLMYTDSRKQKGFFKCPRF